MGKLSGKVALVTGAGSGFGESIAHSYVAEGANVLVADVAVENGKRVASEITAKNYPSGGKAVFVECNVIKKADWQAALDLAVKQFGQLDIVVNNAGTTYIKQDSMGVTEEEFDKVMTVNTKSIYWSVAVIMPYFVERKSGVYLNTSSVAGTRVRPGQVWYGASKAWVNRVGFPFYSPKKLPLILVSRLRRVSLRSMVLTEFESTQFVPCVAPRGCWRSSAGSPIPPRSALVSPNLCLWAASRSLRMLPSRPFSLHATILHSLVVPISPLMEAVWPSRQ